MKRCSLAHNRDLFEAALAGLGQCAIITRAIVDLVPARQLARLYLINYTDNATFFADYRRVLNRGELDEAFNMWIPDGAGGLVYQLNLVKYYDPSHPPDNEQLLRGLSVAPSAAQVVDMPYLDYVLRIDALVDQLKAAELWDGWQRPWFDVFLPDRVVERFVGDIIPTLTPEDVGTDRLPAAVRPEARDADAPVPSRPREPRLDVPVRHPDVRERARSGPGASSTGCWRATAAVRGRAPRGRYPLPDQRDPTSTAATGPASTTACSPTWCTPSAATIPTTSSRRGPASSDLIPSPRSAL